MPAPPSTPRAACRLAATALGLALCLGLPARADTVWQAVADRTLDSLRGGFDAGGGLLVHFGITRALYVNGDLVTQTTLDFGRIGDLTPAQATQLGRQMAALNLVQIGPGNHVEPQATGGAFGIVIQNTLDNQHIANQTVIDARSNALGLVKALNLQSTLDEALSRGVGPR